MRKIIKSVALAVSVLVLAYGTAGAVKPGDTENPNGFPSGSHYNLNIIGKKLDFQCPEQRFYLEITAVPEGATDHSVGDLVETCPGVEYTCPETDQPVYGNVVFVPESGVPFEIYMASGSGKGKRTEEITDFQVIDACTGFADEGSATVQIPPNRAGYDVYARALAKPTNNPSMTVTPELVSVEDDSGNDLIYLGLVTNDGFSKADGDTFTRGKGKSKAVPITGLFEWSGEVCYLSGEDCVDACTETPKCCMDTDLDGAYDECVDPVDGACDVENGYVPVSVFCTSYTDEWVFNIGDFVEYLWNVDNHGLKLLQVRFYPR